MTRRASGTTTNNSPRGEVSPIDATCANHGTVWLVDLLTPTAEAWAEENVTGDVTWFHGALAVEAGCGFDLIVAMRADGLRVEAA